MEKQRPSVTDPHRRHTAEDTTADSGPPPLSRSTVRRAQTPRATRTGDHHSHPGALPPASGWLLHALAKVLESLWFPVSLLVVLAVTTEQVVTKGPLLGLDTWVRDHVLTLVSENPYPILDRLAEHWSDMGDTRAAAPALILATVAAALRARSWKPALISLLAGTALFSTVIPGKIVIGRPGPEGAPILPGQWGWFPSGHTSTAGICYGTAAWLIGISFLSAQPHLRRTLYGATAALCTGVGLCLIWRDYHWFLDVVAGWSLTGLTLWSLTRWAPRPATVRRTERTDR
jgi:undecaprenyl-diphosphatase